MKIIFKVRHTDLSDTLLHLKNQQGHYGSRMLEDYELVLLGDKFNIYLMTHPTAILRGTMRYLEILPKDTPL
jgi:hypothetical protein